MKIKNNLYDIFLHIAIVVLAITTLFLVRHINELKEQISGKVIKGIEIGDKFPSLLVSNKDNIDTLITTVNDRKKILFIFSNDCQYCVNSFPYWEILYSEFNSQFDIFGISVDIYEESIDKIENSNFSYKVYFANNKNFKKSYNIIAVPLTLVLNEKGLVDNYWLGEINISIKDSISNYIKTITIK